MKGSGGTQVGCGSCKDICHTPDWWLPLPSRSIAAIAHEIEMGEYLSFLSLILVGWLCPLPGLWYSFRLKLGRGSHLTRGSSQLMMPIMRHELATRVQLSVDGELVGG